MFVFRPSLGVVDMVKNSYSILLVRLLLFVHREFDMEYLVKHISIHSYMCVYKGIVVDQDQIAMPSKE